MHPTPEEPPGKCVDPERGRELRDVRSGVAADTMAVARRCHSACADRWSSVLVKRIKVAALRARGDEQNPSTKGAGRTVSRDGGARASWAMSELRAGLGAHVGS